MNVPLIGGRSLIENQAAAPKEYRDKVRRKSPTLRLLFLQGWVASGIHLFVPFRGWLAKLAVHSAPANQPGNCS